MTRSLSSFVLSGLCLLAFSVQARGQSEVTVEADGLHSFTDFTLHGQSPEATWTIFERDLQRYWRQRMAEEVPPELDLHLIFADIDMAGKEEPLRNPRFPHVRYYENQFIPRVRFAYRFERSNEDESVAEGIVTLSDPNFDFGGSGRMSRQQYAFAYEFEMLRRWLRQHEPWENVGKKGEKLELSRRD